MSVTWRLPRTAEGSALRAMIVLLLEAEVWLTSI